jgi:hypothetical protein
MHELGPNKKYLRESVMMKPHNRDLSLSNSINSDNFN